MKKLLSGSVILLAILFNTNAYSQVSASISVNIAPPALQVYTQPPCPVDGYLWTPGYWAYGPDGYYWVPGEWIMPPQVGFLWTPGYWAFVGGHYGWHAGYWGPHVGFYGGVNYGYGYSGHGYGGGRWEGGHFQYNTAVSRVNTSVIHNTYVDRTVVRTAGGTRASFNGPGGVSARPTGSERAAMSEHHVAGPNSTVHTVAHTTTVRSTTPATMRRTSPATNRTPRTTTVRTRTTHSTTRQRSSVSQPRAARAQSRPTGHAAPRARTQASHDNPKPNGGR